MWRALRRSSALLRAAALPLQPCAPLRAAALRSVQTVGGRQHGEYASVRLAFCARGRYLRCAGRAAAP
jgi:hypothetical protein